MSAECEFLSAAPQMGVLITVTSKLGARSQLSSTVPQPTEVAILPPPGRIPDALRRVLRQVSGQLLRRALMCRIADGLHIDLPSESNPPRLVYLVDRYEEIAKIKLENIVQSIYNFNQMCCCSSVGRAHP